MYWRICILGIMPICLAAVCTSDTMPPILDYGGLGLAAAVVFFLCKYLKDLTKQHREERRELIDTIKSKEGALEKILKEEIQSKARLAEELKKRPCLKENVLQEE